jgi:ADP-ribose pyrophosphatase
MANKPTDFTETPVSSKTVYRGKLLHVLEDEVRLPNGRSVRREYIRHPGAAVMVPMPDPETVVLVRQFRYPLGRHFYEMPAGKIDPGEETLATAKRELLEECGYEAAEWRHMATIHPCIGYADERMELYLARQLRDVGRTPDEDEFLERVTMSFAEALRWVKEGKITDQKTVIGLLWADKFCSGRRKAKGERRK